MNTADPLCPPADAPSPKSLQARYTALTAGAVLLTGLLLHPSVPAVYRSIRSVLPLVPSQDFGYPAHLTCYLMLGMAAVWLTRPQTTVGRRWLLLGLAAHGILTETAQLAVAGRTFDLLDMACNLTAVTAGVLLTTRVLPSPRRAASA